ncbi:MAG: tagatose-6-phosphate ketose isomerase [Terriglobia bacterium]
MLQSSDVLAESGRHIKLHTLREIYQQPELWPTTLARVAAAAELLNLPARFKGAHILLTGAGTSAYAAAAIASAWPRAIAVPTTDLLVDAERYLLDVDVFISLARSGDSPESAAVVERIRALRPNILQLAITCNQESALAQSKLDGLIILDPRTNDRSLVMTSAFSNLVLAGLALAQPEAVASTVNPASERAKRLLPAIDEKCRRVAARVCDRIVVLSSSPLLGWSREAGLKALEMTDGHFAVMTETYLGLRHGPISFVKADTLVLCLLSSDPLRRLYEADLIRELRSKKLGYLVGIADPEMTDDLFDEIIPAVLPQAPDALRTPYEIIAPQLLGYHLSLCRGVNPDNPSPNGVMSRVVQGFKIHPASLAGHGDKNL